MVRGMKRFAVLVLLAALAAPAAANGRFPSSRSISFRPGSPDDLYLGATFGLLLSHDDGARWYWTCEQNVGYEGTFDPKVAVAEDGTIYATTFNGLRVSRDGGCSFETALEIWIEAIDVGRDGTVWVGSAESGLVNSVYRSTDQAHTVEKAGLESKTIWWKSVKVAPSDPKRVYVTGYQVMPSIAVFVYRTVDGGAKWEAMPTGDFALGNQPLLLIDGVDPTDPQIVYARSVRAVAPVGDRLYRSTDGGAHWTAVLDTPKPIDGVAVRADGNVVVGTAGNPDPQSERGCIYRSSDRGVTFGACESGPQLACLGERGDGTLFGCGANFEPDFFALGRSRDATSWSKVMRFNEMAGPLQCPKGTAQKDLCERMYWPAIATQFGVMGAGDAGLETPTGGGGCCDAGGCDAAGVVGIAIVVGGLLVWRGRRRHSKKKRSCCQ